MSQICRQYNTTTNAIQTRVTQLYTKCILDETNSLSGVYGAVAGLCDLGHDVINAIIIPKLKFLFHRIENGINSDDEIEQVAAGHIKSCLIKHVPSVIVKNRVLNDLTNLKSEYGFLEPSIKSIISKIQKVSQSGSALSGKQNSTNSMQQQPSVPVIQRISVQQGLL